MPHFFFDLRLGQNEIVDAEGAVFVDLLATRREAVMTLAELCRDQIILGAWRDMSCRVRDEQGQVIYSASLKLTEQFSDC